MLKASPYGSFSGFILGHRGGRSARTSASNFLYSSSFFALYSSISFLASSRASLTRFVRSVPRSSQSINPVLLRGSAEKEVCYRMPTFSGCMTVYVSSACFMVSKYIDIHLQMEAKRAHTLLDDLGGVFLSLFRFISIQRPIQPRSLAVKVARTSSNVWMPAEFCADCHSLVSAS